MTEKHVEMERRYEELKQENTRTAARVLLLQELLEAGMSKREAAHTLSEIDPSISRNSAETIVYTNFSGRYRTIKRRNTDVPVIHVEAPTDVSDDEGLL